MQEHYPEIDNTTTVSEAADQNVAVEVENS